MAGPVTREKIDGEVWSSDNVGDSGNLLRPDASTIAAGYKPAGVKPTRKYFNWLTNALASCVAFFENEGFFEWDSTISYETDAIVKASNGAHYISKISSNLGNDPTLDTTWTNWDLLANFLNPAAKEITRPVFSYNASAVLDLIGPGSYPLYGIGRVGFFGTLNYTFTGLANGVWRYLYIDYSTITAPGPITASNLTESATKPTFSSTKGGWYNGDDLCIFVVYGTGTTSYLWFDHDGGNGVMIGGEGFGIPSIVVSTAAGPTYNVQVNMPGFVTRIGANLSLYSITATTILYIRPAGVTGTNGRRLGAAPGAGGYQETNTDCLYLSDDQKMDVIGIAGSDGTLDFTPFVFFLPKGM